MFDAKKFLRQKIVYQSFWYAKKIIRKNHRKLMFQYFHQKLKGKLSTVKLLDSIKKTLKESNYPLQNEDIIEEIILENL